MNKASGEKWDIVIGRFGSISSWAQTISMQTKLTRWNSSNYGWTGSLRFFLEPTSFDSYFEESEVDYWWMIVIACRENSMIFHAWRKNRDCFDLPPGFCLATVFPIIFKEIRYYTPIRMYLNYSCSRANVQNTAIYKKGIPRSLHSRLEDTEPRSVQLIEFVK